ncbi:MAG: nitroreductase family protein [Patescibacteria group bacterium]
MKTINNRTTEYPIDDIFLKRYSPRAMSEETISKDELMTLFDAAHWAPSSYNAQPWRFIYAMRNTPEFDKLFSFLIDFNKDWCIKAAVLVVVISKKTFEHNGKDNVNHSSDTGAAWENLALQAQTMNLVAHGMNGFDYGRAKTELGIPDDHNVEMMIAVGKHGKVENLPEAMRKGETPNTRKPLEEMIFEGKFPG